MAVLWPCGHALRMTTTAVFPSFQGSARPQLAPCSCVQVRMCDVGLRALPRSLSVWGHRGSASVHDGGRGEQGQRRRLTVGGDGEGYWCSGKAVQR